MRNLEGKRVLITGGAQGIGLTLAKRIVETHGGRLWVESEGVGHGATFYFALPNENLATSETAST